jgi:hypothetical protein
MNTGVILEKEGFKIIKSEENIYTASYNIENKNIMLSNVLDFNLIKLIYNLNSDIYEKIDVNIINDNEAIGVFLIKHFFEDIGISQKYSHILIKKFVEKDCITFASQTITSDKPDFIPDNVDLVKFETMICKCNIITPHKIDFNFIITFEKKLNIPPYAEKLIGVLIHKIFIRVKQFIEMVKM